MPIVQLEESISESRCSRTDRNSDRNTNRQNVREQNTTDRLGVIMRQSIKKIRVPFFMLFYCWRCSLRSRRQVRGLVTDHAVATNCQVDQLPAPYSGRQTTPAPDTVAPRQEPIATCHRGRRSAQGERSGSA